MRHAPGRWRSLRYLGPHPVAVRRVWIAALAAAAVLLAAVAAAVVRRVV
jgi:hypothetical protein